MPKWSRRRSAKPVLAGSSPAATSSCQSEIVLPRIHPMRLRLVREPFDHPDYIFELKHDGFRAIAYLQDGESKLVSRNQRNLGFEALKRSLAKLPVENAILDGEIICVDAHGVSQFNQLLSRKGEPVFYAFDLLWLDGEDLRQRPLVERKKRLARLVRAAMLTAALCSAHRAARQGLFRGNLRPRP